MSDYRIETYSFDELDGLMRLPTYQRPLVWSRGQKENFITNISKGFPFGSLLLYRYEIGEPFTLIDGQQRYSTLLEYSHNPELYFPLEDSPLIDELLKVSGAAEQPESAQADLRVKFIAVARELIRKQAAGESPRASFLAEQIGDTFPLAVQDAGHALKITDIQGQLLDALRDYVDLGSLQIPCVIFTGEKASLPEVFANVNLGGRKLTKYQVFAAQWDRYKVELTNGAFSNRVLNLTIDRYEKLTVDRGGLVIEDYSPEEMRNNRVVTLPEFCHALGEMIVEDCKSCWPPKAVESDDTVDTIGYNTLAIAFGVSPKDIGELPERFAAAGFEKNGIAVEELLGAIMSEYGEINARFARLTRRPGTKNTYETAKTSVQLQFLSFFAALWRLRYGAVMSSPLASLQKYKHSGYDATAKNLTSAFVHDMLANQWKGSGDTRLANYVSGSLTYLTPVSKEKLQAVAAAYLDEVAISESINVEPVAKTLLAIFANSHAGDYKSASYDYEHLIPRDTLNKKFNGMAAYKAFTLPGGGLGNIVFLDASVNRGKGSKTLADFAGELFELQGSTEEIYAGELRSANLELLNGNPEPARRFLKSRAEAIINRVVEYVSNE